jgi:hypothetical protein
MLKLVRGAGGLLVVLLMLLPVQLHAQASVRVGARVVPITGAFPRLTLTPVQRIADTELDAGKVGLLAVGPDGTIVVVDRKPLQILAFSPGAGRRSIGRSGAGPGEYRSVESLAWLHDTLVVLDERLHRVSLFSIETGRGLASFPYARAGDGGILADLLSRGDGAVGMWEASTGAPRPSPIAGGTDRAPPVHTFLPVTARGIGPAIAGLRDSTQNGEPGMDCIDAKKTIHIFEPIWPDRGPIRAFAPNGDLISSIPDSLDLLVQGASATSRPRRLVRAGGRVPVTQVVWDSVAKELLETVKVHGKVTCSSQSTKPEWLPMVRAIATDEAGRIWVETTAPAGGGVLSGIEADGSPFGSVTLPARDESVPLVVRGGKLFMVVKDADDIQSVRVFTIQRAGPKQ